MDDSEPRPRCSTCLRSHLSLPNVQERSPEHRFRSLGDGCVRRGYPRMHQSPRSRSAAGAFSTAADGRIRIRCRSTAFRCRRRPTVRSCSRDFSRSRDTVFLVPPSLSRRPALYSRTPALPHSRTPVLPHSRSVRHGQPHGERAAGAGSAPGRSAATNGSGGTCCIEVVAPNHPSAITAGILDDRPFWKALALKRCGTGLPLICLYGGAKTSCARWRLASIHSGQDSVRLLVRQRRHAFPGGSAWTHGWSGS
jgi:hypothetical protein